MGAGGYGEGRGHGGGGGGQGGGGGDRDIKPRLPVLHYQQVLAPSGTSHNHRENFDSIWLHVSMFN